VLPAQSGGEHHHPRRYQDAVRKLPCAAKLSALNAKVFTNTVKGIGQLSVRLRDAEGAGAHSASARAFPRQLLEKTFRSCA